MKYLISLGLLLLLLGCTAQVSETDVVTDSDTSDGETLSTACTTKECFVTAANNCEEISINITEEAGQFQYSIETFYMFPGETKACDFVKTALQFNEEPDIKQLLEGKSMVCDYTKGQFDTRLINGLIFGIENCSGELKDALTGLLAFV